MPPLSLSIVIPTHNTRDLTLACLESLSEAGLTETEVRVVDDGSSDGTAEAIAKRFPTLEVLRHHRPTGFSAAANRGAAATSGEVILFLNSDTEVEPGALLPLVAAFERDPDLGIAGATLSFPDGRPQWSAGPEPRALWLFGLASGLPRLLRRIPGYGLFRRGLGGTPGAREQPTEAALAVDWVTGASLAVRRQVWDDCGPFDETYRFYCQDLDLCVAARQAGWKVGLLPTFRVMHHHGATISQEIDRDSGLEPRAANGQDTARLWSDLASWAAKKGEPRAAQSAVRALTLGGRLRLAGRALAGPFVPRSRLAAYRAETTAYRRALKELSSLRLP